MACDGRRQQKIAGAMDSTWAVLCEFSHRKPSGCPQNLCWSEILWFEAILLFHGVYSTHIESSQPGVSERKRSATFLLVYNWKWTILENFIKKSNLVGSALEVDHTDLSNIRRLTKIYFGARFEVEVLKMDLNSKEIRRKMGGVRKSCLDFYIELCNQIKMRINHQDP